MCISLLPRDIQEGPAGGVGRRHRLLSLNMLRSQQVDMRGHEMLPLADGGQPVYLLPLAGVPLHSERMLGDRFRPPAHPPSAATSCGPVSMGTGARLPSVRAGTRGTSSYRAFIHHSAQLKIKHLHNSNGSISLRDKDN